MTYFKMPCRVLTHLNHQRNGRIFVCLRIRERVKIYFPGQFKSLHNHFCRKVCINLMCQLLKTKPHLYLRNLVTQATPEMEYHTAYRSNQVNF